MPLSVSLFLVQWAIGGSLLLWVTSRRRLVNLGYGLISKGVFAFMSGLAIWAAPSDPGWIRSIAILTTIAIVGTFILAYRKRKIGVSGQTEIAEQRSERVAQMTGIDRVAEDKVAGAEFNPVVDLVFIAPLFASVILLVLVESGPLAAARIAAGTVLLGALTDAMALGHWYLVQPGLPRVPLIELVRISGIALVPATILLLVPPSITGVFTGVIDDGYNGLLGWFWVACVVATAILLVLTEIALREKQYSAVMAATGLLYLAILTGFGVDLVARALL